MPTQVKCPLCQKEFPWEGNPFRPFCSERCRLIDLGKWATGEYAIPDQSHSPPDPKNAVFEDDEAS
jgi:endogenous inhibitor of DNA gyrase (YacG/DUF329 family)